MKEGPGRVGMFLYSAALALGLVFASPWWLLRMVTTQRYREGLRQRLGFVPAALRAAVPGKRVVWVHAVSVGEVLAASRLITDLETALGPDFVIIISTTTRTGQALARERFGADRVFYMPLDFAFTVRSYLRALKPSMLILMESELWPRTLHECRRAGIPVAVVNARVSDRSFARGMKFRSIWQHALRMPTLLLAQSEEDARRLIAMGARTETVQATGNLKYDVRAPKQSGIAELIREVAGKRPVIVAGSTVDDKPASEEEIFLQAGMGPVWQSFPETLLVIAPRHPERFDEVVEIASQVFPSIKATQLLNRGSETPLTERIIVLDTIGDLAAVYGIASVAFVGGSLVKRGGHNPLEPAQFGVPVLMGPSFENFRDVVAQMQASNGISVVKDEFDCHEALLNLLARRVEAAALGARGRSVFEQQQGATARTITALLNLIQP